MLKTLAKKINKELVFAVIAILGALASGISSYVKAESAEDKADEVEIEAKKDSVDAEEKATFEVTAALAILSQRIEQIEESETEFRVYMASMDARDKYFERVVWELYRGARGSRSADAVVSGAPAKPPPPELMSKKKRRLPKSAGAATQQYVIACVSGDPLCDKNGQTK